MTTTCEWLSCGWLWLYAGAALMFLELIVPGFVIFFFGLSAATVGFICLAMGDAFSATWQLIAFSAFSIAYLVGLRRWLKVLFKGYTETSHTDLGSPYVGRVGKVTVDITPPLAGRVEIGDAEWSAVATETILAGDSVKVIAQDNLTLTVKRYAI